MKEYCYRHIRKIIIIVATLSLLFTLFYFNNIKLYEHIVIRVENDNGFTTEPKLLGVSPLGRKIHYDFNSDVNCFYIKSSYLNSIYLLTNYEYLKQDSLKIFINSKKTCYNIAKNTKLKNIQAVSENSILLRINYKTESNIIQKVFYLLSVSFLSLKHSLTCTLQLWLFSFILILVFYFINLNAKQINIVTNVLVLLILIWGYFWIVFAGFHTYPHAEELGIIALANEIGIIKSSIYALLTIDGRYFANILFAVNPFAIGWFNSYYFLPMIIVIGIIISVYYSIKLMFCTKSKVSTIKASAFFVLISLISSPSLYFQLFYFYSSITYFLPWCFLFFWVIFFLKSKRINHNYAKKLLYYIVSLVFMIASFGLNEMFIVINGIVLIAIIIYYLIIGLDELKDIIPALIVGTCCISIVILCPGVINRMNHSPGDLEISSFYTGFNLILEIFPQIITKWLFESQHVITGLVIISLMLYNQTKDIITFSKIKTMILIASVLFIAILVSSMTYIIPIGAFSYSHRISVGLIFGIQIVVFLLIFSALNILLKKIERFNVFIYLKPLFLVFFTLSMLYGENNISLIFAEYSNGALLEYKKHMDNRHKLIYSEKSGYKHNWLDVEIEPRYIYPKSITIEDGQIDIEPNRRSDFNNIYYELFFNVDEIRLTCDSIYKEELFHAVFSSEVLKYKK